MQFLSQIGIMFIFFLDWTKSDIGQHVEVPEILQDWRYPQIKPELQLQIDQAQEEYDRLNYNQDQSGGPEQDQPEEGPYELGEDDKYDPMDIDMDTPQPVGQFVLPDQNGDDASVNVEQQQENVDDDQPFDIEKEIEKLSRKMSSIKIDEEPVESERRPVGPIGCGVQTVKFRPRLYSFLRVINGFEAKRHSWPWLTRLRGPDGLCGSTLIRVSQDIQESDIVLTAAHCVTKIDVNYPIPQAQVIAGIHHDDVEESVQQKRDVVDVRIHPAAASTPNGLINDVAVVKLDRPFRFTDIVRPVCLPYQGEAIPTQQTCFAAGWGKFSLDENVPSRVVQQLQSPVFKPEFCSRQWPADYDEEAMICSGLPEASVCHGDSGGMLACKEGEGPWVQYGITSWGVGNVCTGKPALFARVSTYVDWIHQKAMEMSSLINIPIAVI